MNPWDPVKHTMRNPHTGEEEVRIVITCRSEKEFQAFLQDMEDRMKPKILKDLQARARWLVLDIFGIDLGERK